MNIENKFSLNNKISRAVFIVNDNTLNGSQNVPVQSGWDLDSRAHILPEGFVKTGLTLGTNKDSRYDVFMKRKVLRQTKGKIGYYHSFTLYFGEGFHFLLLDGEKDETVIDFSAKDGCFTLNGNSLSVKSEPGKYVISGVIDLDKKQRRLHLLLGLGKTAALIP